MVYFSGSSKMHSYRLDYVYLPEGAQSLPWFARQQEDTHLHSVLLAIYT